MNTGLKVTAGDVIRVHYQTFTHYGIVSDRIGENGLPMIIDHSQATGTITERTWEAATSGQRVSISNFVSNRTPEQRLKTARQLIGKFKYSLVGFNCEAFVKHTLGLPATSRQVNMSLLTVPSTGYFAHRISGGNPIVTGLACFFAFALTNHIASE